METAHLAARASRDALIDLIGAEFVGMGQTYPLQDIPVPDLRLTVPIATTAKIEIEYSQLDVIYQLHVDRGPVIRTGTDQAIEQPGNGGLLVLETNLIAEDTTFQVYASKKTGVGLGTYLYSHAVVKVGLNTDLPVEIEAPLLDPGAIDQRYEAPRIVDYRSSVSVLVHNSQEGVEYHLVKEGIDEPLSAKVLGTLHPIRLTLPGDRVTKDMVLRVIAFKEFAGNREPQTAQLTARLALKVRANPNTVVVIPEEGILNYQQAGVLALGNTQDSCNYQVFGKPINDSDISWQPNGNGSHVEVPVPGQPAVYIRKPPYNLVWQLRDGFLPLAKPAMGNGSDLVIPLPDIANDTVVIVQARKSHRVSLDPEDERFIDSEVQLFAAVAFLVRPNPAPDLRLDIQWHESGGTLTLSDGQPGVFYQLEQPAGTPVGEPLYFHQKDSVDANQNKGIDQLVIGADFVVSAIQAHSNTPAAEAPLLPFTTVLALQPDSTLHVTATKALTRVSTALTEPFIVTSET